MAMDLGAVSARIEIDDSKATKALESAQQALESLERLRPEVTVGADVSQAERDLGSVESFLTGVLDGMRAEVSVSGDTAKAEAAMKFVEGMLDGLEGEKSTIEVDADTSAAESGLDSVADKAAAAGGDAGDRMGGGMAAGILAGLASIPIAGAVVKIGQSVVEGVIGGIKDGLGQEMTRDIFSAKTGLDAATARKFAEAAGSAYAEGFGASVEGNLDVAREALSTGLIDPEASQSAIAEIVGQLESLSVVAEEEARDIALATSRMVDSGLADNIGQAMDVLVRGFQTGGNAADDLLDTFTEYSAAFSGLGISAEQAMGMLNQGLEAGVRNTDVIADAFNEFGIRMREGTDDARAALEGMGMDAQAMFDAIASGGPAAAEATDQVLDALRQIEDPVARNAAGVALFGTMWEDTAGKLSALDPSSAVDGLGQIEGALAGVQEVLGQSTAAQVERAFRDIEVVLDSVKGAMATAFSEPLSELAAWASGNTAGVLEAIQSWGNMLFNFAAAGVEVAATMTEAFGSFISSTGIAFAEMLQGFLTGASGNVMDRVLGIDRDAALADLNAISSDLLGLGLSSQQAADSIRSSLIDNGIRPVQAAFNEEMEIRITTAGFQDALAAAEALVVQVDGREATMELNLNDAPATMTLGEFVGEANVSEGTVTIAGNRLPADLTLGALLAVIGGSSETVTINGQDYAARDILGTLMHYISIQNGVVKVSANASEAYQTMDNFFATYNGRTLTTYQQIQVYGQGVAATGGDVSAIAASVPGFDTGGAVYGPGGPTDDLVPAIGPGGVPFRLSNGEHVLTADDVADLGGQQGAYALRALIQAGMVKPLGMADGGTVGASSSTLAAPSGPATFHLYDSDGVLMGTMRGVAQHETGRAMAAAVRRTR